MTAPVTILGAGVLGLSIATELTARDIPVRIVDPNGGPGPHGCSWWAGGMLAPYCEEESADPTVVRLGLDAADWWAERGAFIHHSGTLVLALSRDHTELDRFARRTRAHDPVSAAEIAALEPELENRVRRGLFYASESHLTPRQALGALRDGLAAKGVTIQTGAPATVTGLTVDARGLAARDALPDLRGVRGEMLMVRCPEVTLTRTIRLLHPRIPLYIVPRGEGVYMLGATMLESGAKTRVTARAAVEMLSAAYALHPAFAEAEILELGADARPAFPDNLPRLRRRGSTLYANGLYRHGYLLAPAVARMAADHIETGHIPELMDEHNP
ncbi:FAD-dependent oxidoreductase [Paracoccus cavernae]|uniref:FAD-dependent oxidoreductase n=1 Tax=Paracoccus cavernae TaxID=1571207 RepID=A0ABT8DAJ9_9RHOB|nr:FAD-dependent oxidoreductase [Paracoccus cavernae]